MSLATDCLAERSHRVVAAIVDLSRARDREPTGITAKPVLHAAEISSDVALSEEIRAGGRLNASDSAIRAAVSTVSQRKPADVLDHSFTCQGLSLSHFCLVFLLFLVYEGISYQKVKGLENLVWELRLQRMV